MVPVLFNISFNALTERKKKNVVTHYGIVSDLTCEWSGEVCDEEEVCLIVVISQGDSLLLLRWLLSLDGSWYLWPGNIWIRFNAICFP